MDKKIKFLRLVYDNGWREPLHCYNQWWFPIDWLKGIDTTKTPLQANLSKCLYERLDTNFNIIGVYVDASDNYLMLGLCDILEYKC